MKVLILLGLFVVASAFDFNEEWEQWKKDNGKDYKSANEEVNRHVIWETNKKRVELHNENKGVYGYTLAINEFADLDSTEFARMYNGYRSAPRRQRNEKPLPTLLNLPDSVDWRTKGYVTGVKNQGQCGSCWAFSTTGSVEGQHFNATGKLVSLSEQNLVDCSGSEGNEGCNGGLMDDAFEYIIKNGGIDTEESYPYKAEDERCRFKAANVGATISSYHDVPSENEKALQDFVATVGPISVAIDASHNSFQLYSSGVYYEPDCSETELDHGVLAVGYGTDGSKDYWLVKNSWGESWGMEGYIWMSRNRDNNCGIATSASFPIV